MRLRVGHVARQSDCATAEFCRCRIDGIGSTPNYHDAGTFRHEQLCRG
jgi:hypothetical protein